MASSGDKTFSQYCSEIVGDALVHAGIVKLGDISNERQKSFAFSVLNKMVTAWQNDKVFLWKIVNDVVQVFDGVNASYTLTQDYLEIMNVRLRCLMTNNTEITLKFMTQKEYSELGQKEMIGVPSVFTVRRTNLNELVPIVYPVPDTNIAPNYELVFDAVERLEFFKFYSNSGNFPASWLEACTFGLAYRLNPKDRDLKVLADDSYIRAKNSDFEQGDLQFSPNE